MALPVHTQLLGDFRFLQGDRLITTLGSGRLQSLLTFLLLQRRSPQSRQYIAFQLWPDSTEKQARTNLRQLLHHLRSAIPDADDYLECDTQTIRLRPAAPITLDVAEFEAAIERAADSGPAEERAALEEAVGWYRGTLLPTCYEEWIEPERERLHQLHITTLDRLIRLQEAHRDYRPAIENAHRLLQQDDLREGTYRHLMRLHALSGNRAGALKVFARCESVLERELGVSPSPLTREVYESIRRASFRVEAPADGSGSGSTTLVGRQGEWQRMLAAWQRVLEGNAHFLFLEGEAGIGKTRLVEEWLDWAARQGITTGRSRCHAAEGRLAYAPVAEWLRADGVRDGLAGLESVWRSEVARVVPELAAEDHESSTPGRIHQNWQRPRFFEALARAILAARHPLVLMIDDLQWCDRGTIEWLHYLLRHDPSARILIVGTVRAGEVETGHPLEFLRLELRRKERSTEIRLGPLNAAETLRLASEVAERSLPEEMAHLLYRETEGNPLFVVEHVRAGGGSADPPRGQLGRPPPRSAGTASLPPKVHAVITARLGRASSSAREALALAATVGRAFPFELLVEASQGEEYPIVRALEELGRRRILEDRGDGIYDFTHDKLREVAYHGMSPARRRLLHGRVAGALETLHAEDDSVRPRIAAHYDGAGLAERAIPHYQRAAEVAREFHADDEALGYLNRALTLLERLPETRERDERELSLLLAKGPSLARVRGYAAPEMEKTYTRARTLCERLEDSKQLFPVLWGLWSVHLVREELREAHELGSRMLDLSGNGNDPTLHVAGHFAAGCCLFHLGALQKASGHLESAIERYDRRQHQAHVRSFGPDHSVFALAYRAHTLWHLGYPDRALESSEEALERARQLSEPFSEAIALDYAAMLHQFLRRPDAARNRADAAVELCREHGFSYYHGWATIMQGWTRTRGETVEEGLEQMQRGLNALRDRGAALRWPYYLGLLAEANASLGRTDEGLACLDEARSAMEERGESWIAAELHRLRAELLLARDVRPSEAETHFLSALDAARRQSARSLELRAALGLSRLRNREGDADGARSLLRPIYDLFSEGFDTPDLREAAALLNSP